MEQISDPTAADAAIPGPDEESRAWVSSLKASGARREAAVESLHAVLLRAARFEVSRRRATLPHLRGGDFHDLAMQSANDALVAVLAKLHDYRGDSRFTTWVYKFALLEAAVAIRRRGWQGREVPLEPEAWDLLAVEGSSPHADVESKDIFSELHHGITTALTSHQREVLLAITVAGVPIDVLAERRDTTRGALYKTLHDARQKLRAHLASQGMTSDDIGEGTDQ